MPSPIHEPKRPRKPWRVDYSDLGRRRTVRFASKREAQAFVGDLARGKRPANTRLTLAQWSPLWIATHGREWEPRTVTDRSRDMDTLVIPWLGKARIRDISRADVRAWRSAVVASGVGIYAAQQATKTLSACLGDAVDDDIIPANPCLGLRPLRWKRKDREPATLHEVEDVRHAMARTHDRAAVSLMAYAGLRPSELRRIEWSDVRQKTLVIRRGNRTSGGTKTESIRTVPIIPPLADDLAALERGDGTVLHIPDWDNWTMRVFRPAREAAGNARTPYSLRHTAASLWIAERKTVLEVAQLLGHSSPRLTMEVYGHLFAEAQLSRGQSIAQAAMKARHGAPSRAAKRARAAAIVTPSS